MKIILGRYMDGGAWPDTVTHFGNGVSAVDGVKLCGPMGFLSLLEEKLGLPNNSAHGSKRIAVWEGLLKQRVLSSSSKEGAFYAESFQKDSWNTAKRLLQIRDELKEAGALDGKVEELARQADDLNRDFPRLAEMFRLEAEHLRTSPAYGAADRLRLILDELSFQVKGSALAGLISLELATPWNYWQGVWQTLFTSLRNCGVSIAELPSALPLKNDALDSNALASSPVFNGGEHIALTAANLPEAAEALAATLRARLNDKDPGKIILLRTENSVELDGALSRYGLPGAECRNRSTARPFVQVLPLYLRLHLLPFDPGILRQFLLLPVCPVKPDLRRKILRALQHAEFAPWADGFTLWPDSWRKAFYGKGETPPQSPPEDVAWICPPQRVAKELISPSRIAMLASTLEQWANKGAVPPQPKTAELCRRLAEAAKSISGDLSPLAFEKLLDSVLGEGESNAEKSKPTPWIMLCDPGQIWKELDEGDTVIWWDFTDNGSALRDNSSWTEEEKQWLEKSKGCQLGNIGRERLARMAAMVAPFRFARRIVTVAPRFHGSEESMPHPLCAFMPENGTTRLDASAVLSGKAARGFFRIDDCAPLGPAPVPIPWKAQKGRPLELPKKVSPSTLDKVLACPAQWYFKEVLKLDNERNDLAAEAISCGNLAHEIMERLLKEWRDAPVCRSEDELRAHISTMLISHVQDKAARLALPEYEVLRRSMADRLARSFRTLCERMEKDGLMFLDSEQSYRGWLGNAECSGRYDLILGRQGSDAPAIVADMKWSRRKLYKEQAESGRAVQLAAYYYLLAEGRKVASWKDGEPVLAPARPIQLENAWYFLLPEAKIHEAVTPLAEQWKSIEQDWENICTSLASGRLPLAGQMQGDDKKKDGDDSPCTFCSYAKLCGCGLVSAENEDEDTEGQE